MNQVVKLKRNTQVKIKTADGKGDIVIEVRGLGSSTALDALIRAKDKDYGEAHFKIVEAGAVRVVSGLEVEGDDGKVELFEIGVHGSVADYLTIDQLIELSAAITEHSKLGVTEKKG